MTAENEPNLSLAAAIAAHNLTPHAALISRLATPCIHLTFGDASVTSPLGASRFGGTLDLPRGTAWASKQEAATIDSGWRADPMGNESLPFLAQINFADAARLAIPGSPLPEDGVLFAFMDIEQGLSQIRYAAADAVFEPRAFPDDLPPELRYDPCAIMMTTSVSLPQYQDHGSIGKEPGQNTFLDAFDPEAVPGLFTRDEKDGYSRLVRAVASPGDSHQMLGYPDTVQNPVILDWEWHDKAFGASYEYDYVALCDYHNPQIQRLIASARETRWTLLLQIDSISSEPGICWGDGGTHYWWIKRDDLLRRDFSRVRYDFQSC